MLAFSIDYYEMIFRVTQSVELFCAYRLNKGYTQEEFSEIIEISPAYYGKIERGCHGLSLEKLILLHEKLDVDLTYVLTGTINSTLIFDKVLEECPPDKRYDFSQLLKYALNLAK